MHDPRLLIAVLALGGTLLLAPVAQGWAARASDLLGRAVETRDGEPLGRIHDFAIDLGSGDVRFVVVSVGSFLIEDSLIAVAPDALRESADADRRLVLETDPNSLRRAARFADTDWPAQPDIVAAAPAEPGGAAEAGDDEAASDAEARGTATISDGNRTATLSAGERSIHFNESARGETDEADSSDIAAAPGPEASSPGGPFERLDQDGDGVLDRAEIAHEMQRGDRYADIDTDDSGVIEPDEYEALMRDREPTGE